MIGDQSVLGVIIARGGSKGFPGKNLADLAGKPLIAWSVEAGKASQHIDRLIISSDDEAIIATAREYGCEAPFIRDAALADDHATGTEVVVDAVNKLPGYDYVVLLQATSPLRNAEDIDGCIERCVDSAAPSCVTLTPFEKPVEWLLQYDGSGRLTPFLDAQRVGRRQDAAALFMPNGAVYAARTDWLAETRNFFGPKTTGYAMPPERSVDIDTELDLAIAAAIIERARAAA